GGNGGAGDPGGSYGVASHRPAIVVQIVIPKPLFEGIERRGDVRVRRPLPVVALDLRPANAAALIEDEDGGARNAVDLLPRVRRIAQPVPVDDLGARIREQREGDRASPIPRDLAGQIVALRRQIPADRVEADLSVGSGEVAKSGHLPDAVRSPV